MQNTHPRNLQNHTTPTQSSRHNDRNQPTTQLRHSTNQQMPEQQYQPTTNNSLQHQQSTIQRLHLPTTNSHHQHRLQHHSLTNLRPQDTHAHSPQHNQIRPLTKPTQNTNLLHRRPRSQQTQNRTHRPTITQFPNQYQQQRPTTTQQQHQLQRKRNLTTTANQPQPPHSHPIQQRPQ